MIPTRSASGVTQAVQVNDIGDTAAPRAGRPHVILSTGPVTHLFWTTGVYVLWELCRHYDVSLVVTEEYRRDPAFLRVARLCDVKEIVYLPTKRPVLQRHKAQVTLLRALISKHTNVFVVQYNDVYPANLYLARFAKERNSSNRVVIFQAGQILRDYAGDYENRRRFAQDELRRRHKLSAAAARLVWGFRGALKHFAEYYLCPFVVRGRPLKPKMRLSTGKIIYKHLWNDIDLKLYYRRIEMQVAARVERAGADRTRRVVIRHPAETYGADCNSHLYDREQGPVVAILPSYGFANVLRSQSVGDGAAVSRTIAEEWLKAIEVCRRVLGGWTIVWKLHPAAAKDAILSEVTSRIRERFPEVEVLPASEKAHGVIVSATVILSDVSTVLWWASFLPGKTVISLDVFKYRGGNNMRGYEGVQYCRSHRELETVLRRTLGAGEAGAGARTNRRRGTLIDALVALESGSGDPPGAGTGGGGPRGAVVGLRERTRGGCGHSMTASDGDGRLR